ncbi:NEL-type E3 ubiquitin ligase domain-containing protein [Pseudomonas sp. NPDC089395]|uniref:NEL-type E3 ubiquitin ligase domain-containing protein n=1 Tax=Pseudomonas sp. NPDC089395 TaxID=3364460 RepID=UPI003819A964
MTPCSSCCVGDFPGLPEAYAVELLPEVSNIQRRLAIAESKLPLSVADKARSLLQMARLNRSVEGLYSRSGCGDETAALTLALLARLPRWPATVNLALHEGSPFGRRLAVIDPQAEAASTTVLVRSQGQYQPYDSQGLALETEIDAPAGLFEAITALLSSAQRKALSLGDTQPAGHLRELLRQALPESTTQRLQLLGWREQTGWFNPGRRMPDGRIGYPLSGRAPGQLGARQTLLDRLRALYPGMADAELEQELQTLLAEEGPTFARLLEREDDYQQLERQLQQWVGADLQESRQVIRQRFSAAVRRAWRRQGEPARGNDGQRLNLTNLPVRTLPELPGQVGFPHVTELVLNDTPISAIPGDFLRCFEALRELNLANNQLLRVPVEIGYLVNLQNLRLGHNRIRLDSQAMATLIGLPKLSHLDLSHNPIGALQLRFNQLSHLVELNLRHCGLGAWPTGVELCGFLQWADLRSNQLTTVPAAILQMPHAFRRLFLVDGNPLPRMEVMRLFALDSIQEHLHSPEAVHVIDPLRTRGLWVTATNSAAQGQMWDSLRAIPDSAGLFRLLGLLEHTSDFAQARASLTARVWDLLGAIEQDAGLRQQVHELAGQSTTCENSIADRFSALQVRLAVARAEQVAEVGQRANELLALGRGLFRLQRLERFALNDIRLRVEARLPVDRDAVSLLYRVRLRQQLSLPGQPHTMRHVDAADVSPTRIAQALATVQDAETPQAMARDLCQRGFWQRYLRNRHDAAFAAIEQTYAERIEQLTAQVPPLPADALEGQREALAEQQTAELQLLMQELTRQFLHGLERGRG